ncbi:cyclic pyranopterin monophosphate synthase [Candidatus Methanoplasma termitum]|uniref:MoaA1 protein n=1 Tax=Candidatus Methanoplasma termitum TaxID=1577791 RepID=A0A0A7LA80_9ARCH|nr:AmmeMemoRadiSam system radical SAM enzyme [Candidatus Methanoplasma termitum]AIZ55984.1 cyclic pyranopterin monophosphate synthase [Candidatus Methanoplasma termitum]MCL2334160.1 AmmeMemoRadiSam system radical SAM enzyme [Candidatus Methanoplasma sp.]
MEARYYHRDGNVYICDLCPHRCHIQVGGFGRCVSRKAEEDKLIANNYGKVSSFNVDPIEKKPFYHYYPKSKIFSIGGIGCNMSCRHCQNWSISASPSGRKRTTYESPEDIVSFCRKERFDAIAFTYNEPIIWFEYIMDIVKEAPDLRYVLVSNGLVCEDPLRDLCKVTDAMNIDIKGFTDDFYMKVCGAHLADVMRASEIINEEGVHLELTYLVIPGYNDKESEIEEFSEWVRDELSPDTPVHFTRFHPDFEMMNVPITPLETMFMCRETAMECGLEYAYVGNVMTDEASDTYCPNCGALVIRRTGYLVELVGLNGDRCAQCRHRMNVKR